jgi:hypothetical protein
MRTGVDLKQLHPEISPLLQVMPQPGYQDLTGRDLRRRRVENLSGAFWKLNGAFRSPGTFGSRPKSAAGLTC